MSYINIVICVMIKLIILGVNLPYAGHYQGVNHVPVIFKMSRFQYCHGGKDLMKIESIYINCKTS